MRVVEIVAPGDSEQLRIAQRPTPAPSPRQLLVEVHAAGVNRRDLAQLDGSHPVAQSYPLVPGVEVAGVVLASGSDAGNRFRAGDRVCALVDGGGYAEQVCVPADQCLPIPDKLDFTDAAALPEALFTVWITAFQLAGLQQGHTMLVHGGASGIGSQAIQLGRAFGAHVVATAGGPEKVRACVALGADAALDYRDPEAESFEDAVTRISGGRGAHVVLDMVGGDYIARDLSCIAPDGALVVIAYLGGRMVQLDLATLVARRVRIIGSSTQSRSAKFKAGIAAQLQEKVWPLLTTGRIRPVVDRVYPLEACGEALDRLGANQAIGKLVLRVR